ncbi:MAG: hypothetical protein WA140_06085 [Geobacteraceae bacterium]
MIGHPRQPTEHKTVQSRILAYAQEIGWRYVSRAEAEVRRGFPPPPIISRKGRGRTRMRRAGRHSISVPGGIKRSCVPLKVAQ